MSALDQNEDRQLIAMSGLGISKDNIFDDEIIRVAGSLLLRYNPKASDEEIINYGKQYNLVNKVKCNRLSDSEIDKYRIN